MWVEVLNFMRYGHLIYWSHYLDRILWSPRPVIDHKYPAGLSVDKFIRYGRSPLIGMHVEWRGEAHTVSVARFISRQTVMPHSEGHTKSKLWGAISLFPVNKFFSKVKLYKVATRDFYMLLNSLSCFSFSEFYSFIYTLNFIFKLKNFIRLNF